MKPQDLLAPVAEHYAGKVLAFGATPLGVDWPSLPAIHRRILELLRFDAFAPGASLNDLGCGWGAALDVIDHLPAGGDVDYLGIDIAAEMVLAARARWSERPRTAFVTGSSCPRTADFSIASGIFNVKLDCPAERWEAHVADTLRDLHAHSRKGFAVNFMRAAPGNPAEIYATRPDAWVQFCESLGRRVTVTPVPGLDEFTLRAS